MRTGNCSFQLSFLVELFAKQFEVFRKKKTNATNDNLELGNSINFQFQHIYFLSKIHNL